MSLLAEPVAAAPRLARSRAGRSLGTGSAAGLGVAVLWLSILVLLPLAAVVAKGVGGGWPAFVDSVTSREAVAAIRLTVLASLAITVINAVMGTVIAWVLVRDRFPGQRVLEVLIDLPFALPTIVAGLVLLSLYGPQSPVGYNAYATKPAIVLALLFVTLPFVVRTVQPVLLALETDVEEAARSLGAGPVTVFRRIVFPALLPAILSGSALAFGRAMGEYGSVVLISGQLQYKTEVASLYIYKQVQDDDLAGAAATATLLLLISVLILLALSGLQRWAARRV
jgi:sulfate transport system permease protein